MAETLAFRSGPWSSKISPEFNDFQQGSIDVAAETDRHLELFEQLGGLGDKGMARDVFTQDLEALAATGLKMRIVPEVPAENVSWERLVSLMDSKRSKDVDAAHVYPNLWTPGTERESLTEVALASRASRVKLRGLLLNAIQTQTRFDPILHHLSLPVDDYANKAWGSGRYETTQVGEVQKNAAEFEAAYPTLELRGANHHDFAWEVLKHRLGLNGQDTEQLLLRGWMRIPDLGRHSVDGFSVVAGVWSGDKRVAFGGDNGKAPDGLGVGLSAGRK